MSINHIKSAYLIPETAFNIIKQIGGDFVIEKAELSLDQKTLEIDVHCPAQKPRFNLYADEDNPKNLFLYCHMEKQSKETKDIQHKVKINLAALANLDPEMVNNIFSIFANHQPGQKAGFRHDVNTELKPKNDELGRE